MAIEIRQWSKTAYTAQNSPPTTTHFRQHSPFPLLSICRFVACWERGAQGGRERGEGINHSKNSLEFKVLRGFSVRSTVPNNLIELASSDGQHHRKERKRTKHYPLNRKSGLHQGQIEKAYSPTAALPETSRPQTRHFHVIRTAHQALGLADGFLACQRDPSKHRY